MSRFTRSMPPRYLGAIPEGRGVCFLCYNLELANIMKNSSGGKLDKEIVFLAEESPEGGLEARALGMSIFTDGENLEEIKENVRDAVRCHFDEGSQPQVVRLHFVKDEVIAVGESPETSMGKSSRSYCHGSARRSHVKPVATSV